MNYEEYVRITSEAGRYYGDAKMRLDKLFGNGFYYFCADSGMNDTIVDCGEPIN